MLLTPAADARSASRAVQKLPVYAGKWGLDRGECRRGQPSVRITANKLVDVDATCTFKSVFTGPSAWTIRAICVTFDQALERGHHPVGDEDGHDRELSRDLGPQRLQLRAL